MPRDLPSLLYVGIKDSVIALDIATGAELWRTKLKGMGLGIVSLASSRAPTNSTTGLAGATEARRRAQSAAAEG